MGNLYGHDVDVNNQFSVNEFQVILENYYADNGTDLFSVNDLMRTVSIS